jgi:SWI/SNF-related matrix-associated actin-dependent regulator of chromatin subfamily A-like protein 1
VLKLYPYQQEGVEFLTAKAHRLLADDMGLGKTAQVIAAMNKLGIAKAIVVCPASVKYHWAREIAQWSRSPLNVQVIKNGKSKINYGTDVIVINYELLRVKAIYNQLIARGRVIGFQLVVCDEAHYLKSAVAQRTKLVLGRGSFMHFAANKWMLTGTPVLNRPKEFYPILSTLAPETIQPFLSLNAYGKRFCQAQHCEEGWRLDGAANIGELSQRIQPFILRRTREEVLKDLPPQVETVIDLDIIPTVGIEEAPLSTVRKSLALDKIPKATEYIQEMMGQHHKVVVFAHHREVLEALQKNLVAFKPVLVYGGLTAEIKQTAIDSFVRDQDTRIFLAQTLASGVGINGLQGVCNVCIFVELDWSPGIMDQAIGRLRRIGQHDTVFVYYLSVRDSMDTMMDELLTDKRVIIENIMAEAENAERNYTEMSANYIVLGAELLPVVIGALNDIAQILNKHAGATNALPNTAGRVQGTYTGGSTAPAKKAKAVAAAAPVGDPPVLAPVSASVPKEQTEITLDYLGELASEFMEGYAHRQPPANPNIVNPDVNKNVILTQLWPALGIKSLPTASPEQFANIEAALLKGAQAYLSQQPQAQTSALSNLGV